MPCCAFTLLLGKLLCHVRNSDDNNDPMPVKKEDLGLYAEVKEMEVEE